MPRLNARALKCTVVLDPSEIVAIDAGVVPRVTLNISVQDLGTVTTDVAAKSVRKAQSLIAEHGVDGVAVIIQGKLISNNRISEAGLVAQVRTPKPAVQEVAA